MDIFFSINFDYTIPLGNNCNSANGLHLSNKRKFKLPFDWLQIKSTNLEFYETYIFLISKFKTNELNFDNIIKNENGNFNIQFNKINLWIPHEPIESSINDIKINYIKYFNRLLNILNSKSTILIIISNKKSIYNIKSIDIINYYSSYFNKNFSNNKYYFLSVNLDKNSFYNKERKWVNIYINKKPRWIVKNGKKEWIDPLLKEIVNYFKKIKVKNDLSILE